MNPEKKHFLCTEFAYCYLGRKIFINSMHTSNPSVKYGAKIFGTATSGFQSLLNYSVQAKVHEAYVAGCFVHCFVILLVECFRNDKSKM